jgi:hypothetical protein
MGILCVVSLLASLVHHHWAWFVLFDYMLHWFFLLGMVCNLSLDASLVHSYWPLFVFVRIPHWFIITGHGLYCSISFADSSLLSMICIYHFKLRWFIITGSSSLGMVCVVSRHVSLVHHYLAWFVLFNFMLHWFIITGHGLYCLTTSFTGSSLLGIVCIFALHASLILHY